MIQGAWLGKLSIGLLSAHSASVILQTLSPLTREKRTLQGPYNDQPACEVMDQFTSSAILRISASVNWSKLPSSGRGCDDCFTATMAALGST